MLRKAYKKMMDFSDHPMAPWLLAFVSFTESSFSPFPPDPLLIAMSLKNRSKIWYFAALCTLASVIGGLLGYAIGYWLFGTIGEWILQTYHLEASFQNFQLSFQKWGFWLIAAKGLTPIPYKIVTISSGVAGISMLVFISASIIARATRFYMLAGLMWHYGEDVKKYMDKHLGLVMFTIFGGLVLGFVLVPMIWK
jgi:membrane protein YqaA with SNARE-associated domain